METQAEQRKIRRGPVPLPLHLTLAWTSWNGSLAALPHWKTQLENCNRAVPVNPKILAKAQALGQKLDALGLNQNSQNQNSLNPADPPAWSKFQIAVADEVHQRLDLLQRGIHAYRDHPYRRDQVEPPIIWRAGSSKLLDYGKFGMPVLFVPSLVNRGYVLDLMPGRSLLRWLATPLTGSKQMRPLALEWGPPGDIERSFTLTDYITQRLEPALDQAVELAGGPVAVAGYCMGGLLAVALTQRQPEKVSRLALLATPWDFHAQALNGDPKQEPAEAAENMATMAEAAVLACQPIIDLYGELPVDILQTLFSTLDPFLVLRKFRAFAALDPASVKAKEFVALEDWLNDGVPLAGPVAMECLREWYGENTPMNGRWKIAGRDVDPGRISAPSLLVVPRADRIVPPRSALGLAAKLPGAKILRPELGHIGMLTSRRAKTHVWEKLREWLGEGGPT